MRSIRPSAVSRMARSCFEHPLWQECEHICALLDGVVALVCGDSLHMAPAIYPLRVIGADASQPTVPTTWL